MTLLLLSLTQVLNLIKGVKIPLAFIPMKDTQYNAIVIQNTNANLLADTNTIYDDNYILFPTDLPTQFKKGNKKDIYADLPFFGSGGTGGSGVQSISAASNGGVTVDNTNPETPVLDVADWVKWLKTGSYGQLNMSNGDTGLLTAYSEITGINRLGSPGNPLTNITLNFSGAITGYKRLIVIFLCDVAAVTTISSPGTTVLLNMPTEAKKYDTWAVEFIEGTNTWNFTSVNTMPKWYIDEGDFPVGTNRQVAGYLDGDRTAVTLGWAQLSDLETPPTFNTGVLTGAMFDPDGSAMFYFKELNDAVGAEAKALTIPVYGSGGVLKVNDGIALTDAVNVRQLGTISTVLMTKTSGGSDTIPSNFKGKLIITFSGTINSLYLYITSDTLATKAGMEITVLNESPDANVIIVSKTGFNQIKLDAGSSPVAEATIAPASGQYFICNGTHLVGL